MEARRPASPHSLLRVANRPQLATILYIYIYMYIYIYIYTSPGRPRFPLRSHTFGIRESEKERGECTSLHSHVPTYSGVCAPYVSSVNVRVLSLSSTTLSEGCGLRGLGSYGGYMVRYFSSVQNFLVMCVMVPRGK